MGLDFTRWKYGPPIHTLKSKHTHPAHVYVPKIMYPYIQKWPATTTAPLYTPSFRHRDQNNGFVVVVVERYCRAAIEFHCFWGDIHFIHSAQCNAAAYYKWSVRLTNYTQLLLHANVWIQTQWSGLGDAAAIAVLSVCLCVCVCHDKYVDVYHLACCYTGLLSNGMNLGDVEMMVQMYL